MFYFSVSHHKYQGAIIYSAVDMSVTSKLYLFIHVLYATVNYFNECHYCQNNTKAYSFSRSLSLCLGHDFGHQNKG